LKLEW